MLFDGAGLGYDAVSKYVYFMFDIRKQSKTFLAVNK